MIAILVSKQYNSRLIARAFEGGQNTENIRISTETGNKIQLGSRNGSLFFQHQQF